MKRTLELDANRITNKADMKAYLTEFFQEDCANLDALSDVLSEVTDDVTITVDADTIARICKEPYAYKVLLVLGKAADENPHLHVLFRE